MMELFSMCVERKSKRRKCYKFDGTISVIQGETDLTTFYIFLGSRGVQTKFGRSHTQIVMIYVYDQECLLISLTNLEVCSPSEIGRQSAL